LGAEGVVEYQRTKRGRRERGEGRMKKREGRSGWGERRVEVGEGGGWWGGGGSGLSFGAKPREFPKLSNHSTLQAYREDKGGKSGVVARSGGCSREEA
jgi:hypothetical protein